MKQLSNFVNEAGKKVDGKPAEKNGSDGLYGVNEPVDNSAAKEADITKQQLSRNMKRLSMKFKAKQPFFIVGKAGWGKTSIIKQLAKEFGREVITVYLDKAVATDLGGIPVPSKSKKGSGVQEMLPPDWAEPIMNNPDKKYLLFFDEMNQAAPDVMNALMPIVLENEICRVKYDNFFVGAAGNFESENSAVSELSGPLKSRFKPIIIWETNTEGTWRDVFRYLHKKWDDTFGKEFIDAFADNAMLFENPREVEHKIFKFLEELKNDDNPDYTKEDYDTEDYLWTLENIAREDLSRTEQNSLKELAEKCEAWVNGDLNKEEEEGGRGSGKDINMVDPDIIAMIKLGMADGYLSIPENGKNVKYGISKENIREVVDENEVNGEMLERILNKLEADGIKWKYETNEGWKKAGYVDPHED